MNRIYESAKKAAAEAGINVDELKRLVEDEVIDGSGSGGAVSKTDIEAYLEGQDQKDGDDSLPSKEDLSRRGLAEGWTNEEIGELVHVVLGDDVPWQYGFLSWTIGNERRNDSDWWMDYGPGVVVERGVKAGPLGDEALKQPERFTGQGEGDE